jgi:hypothetical protein
VCCLPRRVCPNTRGLSVAKRVRVDGRESLFQRQLRKNHDIFVRIATPIPRPTSLTDLKTLRSKLGFHSLLRCPQPTTRHPSCNGTARCTRPLRRDKPSASFTRSYPTDNLAVHKTVLLSVRYLHGTRAATFSQFRNGPESPKPHIPASIPHR